MLIEVLIAAFCFRSKRLCVLQNLQAPIARWVNKACLLCCASFAFDILIPCATIWIQTARSKNV